MLNECYWCRRLEHDNRDCELWIESNGTLIIDQQQFGLNLRAPPYKTAGRDVIYILGFFEGRARCPQGKMAVGVVKHALSETATPRVPLVDVVPDMEVEWIGRELNVEAVTN